MAKLSDFKPDPRNANKHSEYGTGLLENSLRHNGAGRSIVVSNDNVVMGGNGVYEAAGAIGLERVKVIETDGTEIVVVKRKDIKSNSPEFYNMALADNVVPLKNIVLDTEVVESIAQEYPETKFWTSTILEEPGGKGNEERADLVTMKFELSSRQYAKVKKAFKLAKQIFKEKFNEGENPNEQGTLLFLMAEEFLKNHK